MQLWVLIILIFSMVFVSTLGGTFSVIGLGALFSGATVLVWMMAIGLELAKFAIAAFLHQTWARLHIVLRTYLFCAVVILSAITSMGIFGFLSDAYEQSASTLEEETIKLEAQKAQIARNNDEIARINKAIDEVPLSRITRKMKLRAESEPLIQELIQKNNAISESMTENNLKILAVKRKVGPLIYIARAFNVNIDTAVKYLVLLLVSVFDPLAICLVLAVSESIRLRRIAQLAPIKSGAALKMRYVDHDRAA